MRTVSDKGCTNNQDTHFIFNNYFRKSCAVFETMWKDLVVPERPQLTVGYGAEEMLFACRITNARIQTNTKNM